MKMAQFARFANNATNQVLGITGLQLENLQSMFSYPDAINVTDPKLVSGKVIYIEDGAPLNAKRAKVFIKPFQAGSGDPSPSNPRAINGWNSAKIRVCGNNIFDPTQIPDNAHQTCTVNGNKFILTVLSNGNYKSSTFEIEGNFEGSTLHLSGAVQNSGNNDGRISVRFLHGDTEINASSRLEISAQTGFSVIQAPQGTTKLLIVCYSTFLNNASTGDKSTFTDVVLSMQNELYTPFVSHDYNITFSDEAGTVYVGTLDLTTGILTVESAILNGVDADWMLNGSNGVYILNFVPEYGANPNYKPIANYLNGIGKVDSLVQWSCKYNTVGINLLVKGDGVVDSSVESWKEYITNNPLHILYKLAIPITYQLTPVNILTLNGINTIWTNCGSMEIEYYRRESGDNPYV